MVEVSAKTGQNLDKLLDLVLLVADMEELRAETDVPAEGLVIEAHMEQGRGAEVSMLVEHGVLKAGQHVVAGLAHGRVRTLVDYAGRPLKEAGASTPATVTGFKELPSFGDRFEVVKNEKEARQLVAKHRSELEHNAVSSNVTGSDLLNLMKKQQETQVFEVIVRADVQGSLTSLVDSLKLLETGEVTVRVIRSGVGNISENDVRLASSSGAIIYGFNVQLPPAVKRTAMRDKVIIRNYRVIYELLDDVRLEMEGKLAPEVVETEIGELKVLGVFRTTRDSIIAGGEVLRGKVASGLLVRIKREGDL
jgi:translation initiation factor IF-2